MLCFGIMQALASNPATAGKFILPMPKWVERESSLLRQLQRTEGGEDDGVVHTNAGADVPEAAAISVGTPPVAPEPVSVQ